MADWKDILSDEHEQLSEEDLLMYLDENTPESEKLLIEKKADTPFERDALEGLQQIKADRIKKDVTSLNQKLQQQLLAKKHRQEKGKIKDFQWMILTILILLFICIFGYLIIRMQNNNKGPQTHSTLLQQVNTMATINS